MNESKKLIWFPEGEKLDEISFGTNVDGIFLSGRYCDLYETLSPHGRMVYRQGTKVSRQVANDLGFKSDHEMYDWIKGRYSLENTITFKVIRK